MGKPSRLLLAERADRVARRLEADTLTMMHVYLTDPYRYVDLVTTATEDNAMTDEQFDTTIKAGMPPSEYEFLRVLSQASGVTPGEDLIQLRRWQRTRIIYALDPTTAAAVQNTDWGTVTIPGEVLRRLPHENPMVVLPEPIDVPADDGTYERYEAFVVLGVRGERRRCSTHHPEVDRFVLHFYGRIVDPVTKEPIIVEVPGRTGGIARTPQIIGMRIITPLTDMTMAERQQYAEADLFSGSPLLQIGFTGPDQAATVTRHLTTLGLSLLVYLTTSDVDSNPVTIASKPDKNRKRRQPGNKKTTPPTHTTVIEVGYRIGAALRAAHTDHPHTPSTGTSGTRTVAPHVRRAHIHTFRTGKGRTERILKWLPPVPVAWKDTPHVSQVHFPK